jgi:UDP-N-acetylmuramyl tripeptide synthase
MEVRDSRRLTGPNLLQMEAGPVLDIYCADPHQAAGAVAAWERAARRLLTAVGWGGAKLAHRHFAKGISLAFDAPIDALYAATEVNEKAWEWVHSEVGGTPEEEFERAVAGLRQVIAEEGNPRLMALRQAAFEKGLRFLWDDDRVSIGLGAGSQSWAADALPEPSQVAWEELYDIPAALITGTNGKTTTVRLLAAMARAAGLEPGMSSTDGVWVAGEEIGEGDYSGPGGARLAMRDRRVKVGLLETARGGMLRRGLGLYGAQAALITNVAEDHLGEWGVHDLEELAATKLIIRHAARRLVLNGDDSVLWRLRPRQGPVPWVFSLHPESPAVASTLEAGGEAFVLAGDSLQRWSSEGRETLAELADIPMTLWGAARHNVANALGACAVGVLLGFPEVAIRQGLRDFASTASENPGRLNRFDLGGVRVIVDFAHNPHGVEALLEMANRLPAERRLILIGQAGDRAEEDIRKLARGVWQHRPDRIIAKELGEHLRGREAGEIPAILADELRRQGAPEEAVSIAASEMEAVHQALDWAKAGDLLLLIAHERRGAVLDLVSTLEESGWQPGEPLPGQPSTAG